MSKPKIITKGHGLTDISCEHGSRWIWWFDSEATKPLGEWMLVIMCSNCDCEFPPLPFKTKADLQKYLNKKGGLKQNEKLF